MFQPMLLTGTTVSTLTDGGDSGITNAIVGSFDKYMNAELFNLLCNNFAETVAMVCWCAMSLAVKKEEITLQVTKKEYFLQRA